MCYGLLECRVDFKDYDVCIKLQDLAYDLIWHCCQISKNCLITSIIPHWGIVCYNGCLLFQVRLVTRINMGNFC